MPADDIRFVLRIPVELSERLRLAASVTGESLNALICRMLGEGRDVQSEHERRAGSHIATESKNVVREQQEQAGEQEGLRAKGNGGAADERAKPETENGCPDCGDPLVWNKILKRWVCECGYQGKKTS